MKRLLRWTSAAGIGCFALLASGCTGSTNLVEPTPGWETPNWMAEQRRQVEEWDLAMQACFSRLGLEAQISRGGGVFIRTILEEGETDTTMYLRAAAWRECLDLHGQPAAWTEPADERTFAMMLDVRECLIAHGQTIPEPPALEVWVEQPHPWNPFEVLWHVMDDDEIGPLLDVCQQAGPGRLSFSIATE